MGSTVRENINEIARVGRASKLPLRFCPEGALDKILSIPITRSNFMNTRQMG
jgi:hypothetical protein